MLGALGERPFRLLWLGQAASVFGNALVPVALAFAVLGLTGSATDVGFVLAAETVPMVVFLLAGGVWADRLPRQLVMLASDVIRGATQATIAVLLLMHEARLWHLLVLSFVYGSAEAFFRPASTGLVPSTVSPARLQQANALFGISTSVAQIAGPAVAGLLVALAGAGIVFAVDAGTFVASTFSLALLRVPRPERPARESFLAELVGGWREFVSHTWLWVVVLWASLYLLVAIPPIFVLGPLVAKQSLGGAGAWGVIVSAFGAGALLGHVIALRWKPERPMVVGCFGISLTALSPAMLALRWPLVVIVAVHLAAGLGAGLFDALWDTTMQQHVSPSKLSRVSSYDWLGSIAFMPLGLALAGPVASVVGISTTLWIAAAWVVVSSLAVFFVREIRELRRLETPSPEAERISAEPLPVP